MKKQLFSLGMIVAGSLLVGIGTARAWSVEGKVDLVDLRAGNYNAASSFIYIAPKASLPVFRWFVNNRLERCNDLATDALGSNDTVIFQGTGDCAAEGAVRRCPGVATRCLVYRNR